MLPKGHNGRKLRRRKGKSHLGNIIGHKIQDFLKILVIGHKLEKLKVLIRLGERIKGDFVNITGT